MSKYRPRTDFPLRLVLLGQNVERHVAKCHVDLGLTWWEAESLRVLREYEESLWAPEGMAKAELALQLGQRQPTVSKIVKKVGPSGLGLLAELKDPKDGRRELLSLTEEGRRVADQYADAVNSLSKSLLRRVRKDFVDALDKLERALSPGTVVRRRRTSQPPGPIKKQRTYKGRGRR